MTRERTTIGIAVAALIAVAVYVAWPSGGDRAAPADGSVQLADDGSVHPADDGSPPDDRSTSDGDTGDLARDTRAGHDELARADAGAQAAAHPDAGSASGVAGSAARTGAGPVAVAGAAGAGGASASATPLPPAAVPSVDPLARPAVVLDHPPTPEEQLDRASRVYDYIILRRDDVRRRIAEVERSDDQSELERLRRELAGLEESAPAAHRRVEGYAAEVRAAGSEETNAPE